MNSLRQEPFSQTHWKLKIEERWLEDDMKVEMEVEVEEQLENKQHVIGDSDSDSDSDSDVVIL